MLNSSKSELTSLIKPFSLGKIKTPTKPVVANPNFLAAFLLALSSNNKINSPEVTEPKLITCFYLPSLVEITCLISLLISDNSVTLIKLLIARSILLDSQPHLLAIETRFLQETGFLIITRGGINTSSASSLSKLSLSIFAKPIIGPVASCTMGTYFCLL